MEIVRIIVNQNISSSYPRHCILLQRVLQVVDQKHSQRQQFSKEKMKKYKHPSSLAIYLFVTTFFNLNHYTF